MSGIVFWVSGILFGVSGIVFWVSGFVFGVSGFVFWVSGFVRHGKLESSSASGQVLYVSAIQDHGQEGLPKGKLAAADLVAAAEQGEEVSCAQQ